MYASSTVIYADVLFLINFSLDFLCLFLTSRILNCSIGVTRLLSGALLGAVYAFLPYLADLGGLAFPLHLIAAAVICLAAFGRNSIKRFIIITATFIVSSALMGGLISAVYGMSSQYSGVNYAEIKPMTFFVICVFSALIALSYGLICRKKINTRSVRIRVTLGREDTELSLLVDSGNLVTEPFSALPVIVVSSSALPPPYDMPELESFPLPIRAIPFSTSAGSSCFFGFKPKSIRIIRLGKKPKSIEAYIGIDTQSKGFSGYDGLMPSALI